MSRQINFFHLPDETAQFIDVLRSRFDLQVLNYKIYKEEEIQFKHPIGNAHNRFILFDKKEIIDMTYYQFIEKQGYFLFKADASNYIEYSTPEDNKLSISPGRFYTPTSYWENDICISKEQEFIKHTLKMYNYFKKNLLQKFPDSFYYYSKQVGECLEQKQLEIYQGRNSLNWKTKRG